MKKSLIYSSGIHNRDPKEKKSSVILLILKVCDYYYQFVYCILLEYMKLCIVQKQNHDSFRSADLSGSVQVFF